MTMLVPTLDHVVINARDEMDAAADIYRRLGFTLTPRGYHTLGSMNHLAMFATDYLELIAMQKGVRLPTGRTDLVGMPAGLNGLVFGSEDSAATHAAMVATGVPVEPPQEFSRPVELAGGKRDAVFRTVRIPSGTVPAGRFYFCQHFTRDLVWRDEWRHHANGAVAVDRAVIADADPAAFCKLFERMFGPEAVVPIEGGRRLALGNARFDVVTPAELTRQFGTAQPDAAGRSSYMAALSLRTRSLDQAAAAMAKGGIKDVKREGGRLIVPAAQAFNATLEFVA